MLPIVDFGSTLDILSQGGSEVWTPEPEEQHCDASDGDLILGRLALQDLEMDSQIPDFKDRQRTLLDFIQQASSRENKTDLLLACKNFLTNQKQQLPILRQNLRIHMNERGKLDYRLAAEEKVSLSMLKDLYSSFAKSLEEFIQRVTFLSKSTSARELTCFKMEAVGLVREMLKICLVLDKQPACTNYEKQKNESPNLIFLGVHCLSNITISNLLLNAVSESDLHPASRDGVSLENVGGFQGFNVKQAKQPKTSGSKTSQKLECLSKNLGTWSIQKDQLNTMEKGSAHKDFLRLRYTAQIKYNSQCENLMLLSLPFNIRKSSCQLFTFTGALMWYFYTTDNPYETFTVIDRLPTRTVVEMLTTRIRVIGRQVSSRAEDFFMDRINNLSSNERVELETLAKGPSTNKEDHVKPPDKTRTEDEAIECYGFFTWFFALAKSLDIGGYLNSLWNFGHIYDICDFKHVERLISQPQFGFQTAILRPSMSTIAKYQGEDINMGLAFFFKQYPHHVKVYSLNLSMEEVKTHGLYRLLTPLPLEFIYLKDDVQRGLDVLDSHSDHAAFQDKQYHGTRFQMASAVQLSDPNAKLKHCSTCRCDREDANSVDSQESQAKKVRIPSDNSDRMSSVSEPGWPNLPHKHREANGMSTSIEDWRSLVPMSTGLKDEQVASPSNMTNFSSPRSNLDYPTGSPDSRGSLYMNTSPSADCLPSFECLFSTGAACAEVSKSEPSSIRDQLISNCKETFNALSSCDFPTLSDEEIKLMTNIMVGSQTTVDGFFGQGHGLLSNGYDRQGFLPVGYQVSQLNGIEQVISPILCLPEIEDGVGNLLNLDSEDSLFVGSHQI